MTPRLALIALMTLPLAACEGVNLPGLGTAAPQVQGHKGPPGVSPLEQPIETGAELKPVSTAEASTYNTTAFSARGNEPAWSVDVAGSTAIYKTPDSSKGRPIRVNRLAFAQGVEYVGVHAGRPFVLNVRAAECEDSASGQDFPFTARLTVSGKSQAGCAAPATPEVAQAVAATKAPAPAAPRQATTTRRPAAARPAPTPAAATEEKPAATPATTTPAATTPAPEAVEQTPPASTPATTTPPAASTPAAPASEGTADLPPPPAADAPAAATTPAAPVLPATPAAPAAPADQTTTTEPAE
ncbi:hypothetical protein [Paracoccus benzoatiresistens]|uniref:Uncharacterized protein n=1 Tax=Paracoccus benzoatiresistens TaxID=2997341 RepID=A0ABT4J4B3_9RHOB|nr:hypothetical protein [Paracoccus sp. EF6]MCZ0961241.1 hypothetical protein [Paracoccus sp. EF6]